MYAETAHHHMKQIMRSVNGLSASLQGIVFITSAMFVFSLQDVTIKWISDSYPIHQIVFVRSLVGILPILFIVHLEGGLKTLRTQRPFLQFGRAMATFCAFTFFYLALAALPLADTVALFFSAPLFVTLLSVYFLGEKIGWRRWAAVTIGFIGVIIMLHPGVSAIDPAAILATLSAIAYAIAAVLTRRLGVTDTSSSMTFYAAIFYLVFSAIIAAVVGMRTISTGHHASLQFLLRAWSVPPLPDFGYFILLGLIWAVAFYLLTQAYRVSRATTVTPFEYTAVPLAIFWGFLIWREFPNGFVLLGMCLVVGSSLYILWRELLDNSRA